MATGFSGDVTFSVVPDGDARLPQPVFSTSDESRTYDATILLASYAEYDALESYLSGYTLLPAMGGGGLVVVTRGRGTRTLVIPLGGGIERAYRALLVAATPRARMLADSYVVADVSFLILAINE